MSGEDFKEKMDKNTNTRQRSSVQKNFNEVSKNQRSGRKRGNGNGGNFSISDGPSRKPTPQKNRSTWDKRPRSRTDLPSRGRSDLGDDADSAEYGAAIQTGSKKGNLNHLLNFTFEERETSTSVYRGGNAGWTRGRHFKYKGGYFRGNKVYYNKETYLQANCQFLVKKDGDYQVHMMDPDVLVDWDSVEQIKVTNTEEQSCPICLQHPKAAKMTRCGHIYCWACILHYLALGEKSWRKCPICYESIHSDDLKSVGINNVNHYKAGDTITMTLMKKEKGSIYAVPANSWQKQPKKCHNIRDSVEVTCHQKLLTVSREQVMDILNDERDHLMIQQVDAEVSEEPFIKGALQQLEARELKLKESFITKEKVQKKNIEQPAPEKVDVKVPSIPVKQTTGTRKIKQYKDAFDDEVLVVDSSLNEVCQTYPVNMSDESSQVSLMQTDESSKEASHTVADKESSPTETDPTEGDNPSSKTEGVAAGSPAEKAPLLGMIMDGLQVEEAAEHLELPSQEQDDRSRNASGDDCFYFYQAEDGQHVYLHSLNARCLVKEYGSLKNSPQKITGEIVEKESGFVSDELRRRLRYLSHLPVTCSFNVTEIVLKPPVISKETLKNFDDDIQKRRKNRQKKNRDEKRISRKIEDMEKKKLGIPTGFHVRSDFHQPVDRHNDTRSDTSSPSLDTPVGSPPALNVHAAEFTPGTRPPISTPEVEDGSQTTVISFAQMIRAGTQATVWPKSKTDSALPVRTRQLSGSHHKGSDESDSEDRVPVPQFRQSFGSDIQAALENIERKTQGTPPQSSSSSNNGGSTGGSGKKKKKQLMLFSTSMARGGN